MQNDIQHILTILIPLTHQEDKLIKHYNTHGKYTVKFGYFIAGKILHRLSSCKDLGSSSS